MYKAPIVQTVDKYIEKYVQETDDYVFRQIERKIDFEVDREELIKALAYDRKQYEQGYKDGLEAARTVDAVEVKHGRWLGTHDGWYYSYSCSECGAEALTKEETMHDQVCSPFCPNCGAKLDGERKDNSERT